MDEKFPWRDIGGACPPAVLVDAAVAEHLKVLDGVCALCLRMVPRVGDALAFQRKLLDAVDRVRKLNASGFVDGGCDVGDVRELAAQAAGILDARRPGAHAHAAAT